MEVRWRVKAVPYINVTPLIDVLLVMYHLHGDYALSRALSGGYSYTKGPNEDLSKLNPTP